MKNKNRIALYICDAHQSRMSVARALRSSGFETIIARYDSDVFEEISDLSSLDIVVLDRVYDAECLECCNHLRDDKKNKNIPIVAILADRHISQDQMIKSGIDLYVKAPVNMVWFEKMISAFVMD